MFIDTLFLWMTALAAIYFLGFGKKVAEYSVKPQDLVGIGFSDLKDYKFIVLIVTCATVISAYLLYAGTALTTIICAVALTALLVQAGKSIAPLAIASVILLMPMASSQSLFGAFQLDVMLVAAALIVTVIATTAAKAAGMRNYFYHLGSHVILPISAIAISLFKAAKECLGQKYTTYGASWASPAAATG